MKKHLFAIIMSFSCIASFSQNVGVDPVLPGLIAVYMKKADDQYEAQLKAMGLQTTGHVWLEQEVSETVYLHKKFNEYLDSFRSVISFAAQVYGFYYEISKLTDRFSDLTSQISKAPSNLLAVSLHSQRNKINRDLIIASTDIINDIRKVCLTKNKMTEKERVQLVLDIRPKLKEFNRKLGILIKSVKYTALCDVWAEITFNARDSFSRKDIIDKCLSDWKRNAKGDKK